MNKILVNAEPAYQVTVGNGLTKSIADSIEDSVNQIAIIYAPVVQDYVEKLFQAITEKYSNINIEKIAAPDSESAKNYDFVNQVWNQLGRAKFTRSDVIISVGGGATTDVAGFIAATWLRGIGIIHVPSTLLAMVDAAVGGKTGINTGSGKNLVGSFHNPLSVWCDLDLLISLPEPDLRAGFAEVIKCGFIAENRILEIVEKEGNSVLDPQSKWLQEVIELAIKVKAEVVAADFRENQIGGLGREVLNYGHTLGHAIENVEEYKWRHGDAISVGMMFVAELSAIAGYCNDSLVERQRGVLIQLGLPTTYQGDFERLLEVMSVDKKARGKQLRFIGLSDFAKPVVITAPSMVQLEQAFLKVSAE